MDMVAVQSGQSIPNDGAIRLADLPPEYRSFLKQRTALTTC
jgi:hypothetical protein